MKKCPFCAEEIQVAAIVCKHCGRDLIATKPAQPTISVLKQPIRPLLALGSLIVAVVFVYLFVWSGGVSGPANSYNANRIDRQRWRDVEPVSAPARRDDVRRSGTRAWQPRDGAKPERDRRHRDGDVLLARRGLHRREHERNVSERSTRDKSPVRSPITSTEERAAPRAESARGSRHRKTD